MKIKKWHVHILIHWRHWCLGISWTPKTLVMAKNPADENWLEQHFYLWFFPGLAIRAIWKHTGSVMLSGNLDCTPCPYSVVEEGDYIV